MNATAPDLSAAFPRRAAARRPPRITYEIRVCDSCSRESLPRASRPRPFGELPCQCSGREFTIYPLEALPARAVTGTAAA